MDNEREISQSQPACNPQQQLEGQELSPSEEASALIMSITDTYGTMLYEESERVARRARVDHEISVDHVKKALDILKEREKRHWTKGVSGIVAGALFGVALAPLASVSAISSISTYQYVILSICIVIGILLGQYSVSD